MKRILLAAMAVGFLLAPRSMTAQASGPYQFFGITPCRVVDTRNTGHLFSGTPLSFKVIGNCGVPSTAKAASFNVTMIAPQADGFLKIWPYLATSPMTSNINATAGTAAIANMAVVLLTGSTFDITVAYGVAGGTFQTDVAIDVTGYYQ